MTSPHPRRVHPLMADLGTVAGQRLVLLSCEVYDRWADLRFARIDVGAERPLPRRVPPADAWTVTDTGGTVYTVVDAVGRGDRGFSNGEARLAPPPEPGVTLEVTVALVPDAEPLRGAVTLTSPEA